MEIRTIKPEEWDLLRPIFEAQGKRMPDPAKSDAAVAFDEHGLCGFWVVQMVAHTEPLWVREDHRERGLWKKLHEVINGFFDPIAGTGYYSFSDSENPKGASLLKSLGYKERPNYRIWEKEF